MAEVRSNWEGRNVNGVFPLRRFLGSSNHSSVFLTESSVEGFLNAAIKLVPADPAHSQLQLWQWKTASTFSHPHLMRLLDSGQCEIDGESFLFVVMEYAEESLSQILPYRALAPDEVQELLVPTLDALAFLHNEKWIQGQLKPSNFLVVDDQLKLAVDTIRPVGVSRMGPRRPSIYDAPESDEGHVSAASDIWALGVTVTEALTQYPPTWLGGRTDPPTFPTNLPSEFAETVQRCLSVSPGDRPTVTELQVRTKPGDPLRPSAAPQTPGARPAPQQASPMRPAPSQASAVRPASPQTAPPQSDRVQSALAPSASPPSGSAQPASGQTASARNARAQTTSPRPHAPPQAASPPPPQNPRSPNTAPPPISPQTTAPTPSVARPETAMPPAPALPPQIPQPELPMRADSRRYSEDQKRGAFVPLLFALLVVGGAIWGGTKLLGRHVEPQPATDSGAQDQTAGGSSAPEQAANESAVQPSEPGANSSPVAAPSQRAPRDQGGTSGASGASANTTPRQSAAPARATSAVESPAPSAMARANTSPTRPSASASTSESAVSSSAAVHEEIPKVSASSRSTIHGHVRVAVKVTVDNTGRVIHDVLDNPSSSNYFNRVASEAARKWRFATADQGSREWLLRFEFGRDGTTVKAVGPRS